MKGTELFAKAARLETRASEAAFAAAVAARMGQAEDSAAWERRALRLETMAADCRKAARN